MNKAKAMQILAIRLQNRQDAILNDELDSDRRAYPYTLFFLVFPLHRLKLEQESAVRRIVHTIILMFL